MSDMTRREFIALIGGAALLLAAKVRRARAQQPAGRLRHIGLLHPGTPPNPNVEAFRQGLRDLGYVDGQNIVIEYRWAEGMLDPDPTQQNQYVMFDFGSVSPAEAPPLQNGK